MKHLKVTAVILALGFMAGAQVRAEEGYFRKDQLNLAFSASSVESASLLVEESRGSSPYKHVGNAFFVSSSGLAITNGHIAASCLHSNKELIEEKYGNRFNLYRKGFVAKPGEGLSCGYLRVTNKPLEEKRYRVELLALAPIAEEDDAPTPQQALGPHYDFAILHVIDMNEPHAWFSVNARSASELAVGSETYMVGYPAKTARFDSELIKSGKYDEVKTGDYRISVGKILEVKPEYFYQPNKDLFLYTSNDGAGGSSGSALLGADGKLLGLISGSGDAGSSTSGSGCNGRLEYCGGVALYLKTNHMLNVLQKNYPEIAREISQ